MIFLSRLGTSQGTYMIFLSRLGLSAEACNRKTMNSNLPEVVRAARPAAQGTYMIFFRGWGRPGHLHDFFSRLGRSQGTYMIFLSRLGLSAEACDSKTMHRNLPEVVRAARPAAQGTYMIFFSRLGPARALI